MSFVTLFHQPELLFIYLFLPVCNNGSDRETVEVGFSQRISVQAAVWPDRRHLRGAELAVLSLRDEE